MPHDSQDVPFVILVAPNVSQRMGGEGNMALQIYEELHSRGVAVRQITHARVRDEMTRRNPGMNVDYVEDDRLQLLIYRSSVLAFLMTPLFFWKASRFIKKALKEHPDSIVHIDSPVSPVVPIPSMGRSVPVIIGPLDGNIHHPKAFRGRESHTDFLRRILLKPTQLFFRLFFHGKSQADVLLVSGGQRTRDSLKMAGCRESQFRESLCSGIPTRLRDDPLVVHSGPNLRFVHNGRLVAHKGTDLILKAMAKTEQPVELDVIGRGPEKEKLVNLTAELGLQERVRFIEWFEKHEDLQAALRGYRGFVLPSLAEAHGIVVQESMMMGLPVICADWGGPARLVTPECGFLAPVSSEEALVSGIADAMDRLAADPDLANNMARKGRAIAIDRGFSWSDIIDRWIALYRELGKARSDRTRSAAPVRV